MPAVVCFAFSIELGIKALILAGGGSVRGHNLQKLFNALPEDIRGRVKANVYTQSRFEAVLARMANTFEDWRYVYERSHISVDLEFLRRFQKAIEIELRAMGVSL